MIHPSYFSAVDLWFSCRWFDPAQRMLPEAGGMGDQCAVLIDAFEILSKWHREEQPPGV